MANPVRYDARTPRGDSFVSKTFAVVIDEHGVDLSDFTITAQFRRAGVVAHEWDDDQIITGSGVIDYKGTELTTGWLRLETPAETTEDWPIGVGSWDWQMSNSSATYTLIKGSFRVTRDVTY